MRDHHEIGIQAQRRSCACYLGVSLLIAVSLSGCFGAFKGGSDEALKLETAMHQQMARGDVAGIYNDADQRFRDAITPDKSDALFTSIVRKLGTPQDCKQGGTFMQVGTMGTTIRSECQTTFSKNATAQETFVWMKSKDRFRLVGYKINSNELIER